MTDEKQTTPRVWGIHATEEPRLLIERNCIALGSKKVGDLSKMPRDREAFKAAYSELRRDKGETKQSVANVSGQLLRFAWEAKIGEYVVYPMPGTGEVWIGRITGEYRHEPSAVVYSQQRDVAWLGHWERVTFSPGAQSALGVLMTFWQVRDFASEFLCRVGVETPEAEKPREQIVYERIYSQLGGIGFEEFVAELFRLYGYSVTVTQRSGDHGVDIVATLESGLFPHTVRAQVKRHNKGIPEKDVQQLRGVLNEGELGVIISYAGLQPNARKFAEAHGIASVGGLQIRDLALKHEKELSGKWPDVFAVSPRQ